LAEPVACLVVMLELPFGATRAFATAHAIGSCRCLRSASCPVNTSVPAAWHYSLPERSPFSA
jgi:hypothetical protein